MKSHASIVSRYYFLDFNTFYSINLIISLPNNERPLCFYLCVYSLHHVIQDCDVPTVLKLCICKSYMHKLIMYL